MRVKSIEIRGLSASIVGNLKKNNTKYVHQRRIVSPEWIQLWFLVANDQFDSDLWQRLSQKDQDFMGYAVHACDIHNTEFQKALSRSYASIHRRLLLVEGSIANGNLNRELVDEYKEIVDRLADSLQMGRSQATNLKKRIERTYAAASGVRDETPFLA